MRILINNIKSLVQVRENSISRLQGKEMADLPVLEDAFLLLEDGKIADCGHNGNRPDLSVDKEIDASGRYVLPGFVDSHTHLVFPRSREGEFVDKINGLSYEEIAAKGGGILNSARAMNEISEDELLEASAKRLHDVVALGTVMIEIKSGYGLSTENELKMLRVANRLKSLLPIDIKTTFLGAHAFPLEYRENRRGYIDLIKSEMIPAVAEEKLADYIDVFCERGFFTREETEEIVECGKEYGLIPKIHANQLSLSGGVQAGVATGAISVDHLEIMSDEEIEVLKGSSTMPVCLPGSAFYLNAEYPPARKMISEGLGLAIATDFNPGSAPSGSMAFNLSLASIKMKLTPAEAINAATINAAYAVHESDRYGSITKGKEASVLITREIPSIDFLPYAFASDQIETVILKGEKIIEKASY